MNVSIELIIYCPLDFIDASTSQRNRPLSQKSAIDRKRGKNDNRKDGKHKPKNKPQTEDGTNRTDESQSQVETSEY